METNEEYVEGLKEKREQAIKEGDRESYTKITLELGLDLGLDLGEVPDLAKEPEERDDLEKIVLEEGEIENIPLKVDKSKCVEIMNARSFQNIKQSCTRRKLKEILGKLEGAGYETTYSPKMNTVEMWNCYFKDRRVILNL